MSEIIEDKLSRWLVSDRLIQEEVQAIETTAAYLEKFRKDHAEKA